MRQDSTEVVRHGLLTKRRARTVAILCGEFPMFLIQVVLRRLQCITGLGSPFLLNVATSILIGYRKRFLNTEYGPFAPKAEKHER